MKTKELIRQLNEADPSGEEEVCVGNTDIHFADRWPAYYDGCLQVLKRDESNPCYNITGAEIRGEGVKVQIHTLSIKNAILEDPDMEVTFDGEPREWYVERIKEWRKEAKINEELCKAIREKHERK